MPDPFPVTTTVVATGLAVFDTGRSVGTSGSFQSTSNTPSYMHRETPSSARWKNFNHQIAVIAWHPRITQDWQVMLFRLIYEYNGYDIRNARVVPLVDASSGMYSSKFIINWGGQAHSPETSPVAEIMFLIAGEWDPVGRGQVSFYGELLISAAGRNIFEHFWIKSEKWVYARASASPLRIYAAPSGA